MKDLPNWMAQLVIYTAIAAIIGGAIDFALGRSGQQKAKELLETWWIKFDDVRWNNFGRKEALFAVHLIDFWCGRRFFSLRRWILIYALFSISIIFGHVLAMFQSTRGVDLILIITPPDFVTVPLSAIGLAVSLSLTRLIAVIVAGLCTDGKLRNFTIFTIFLILTYFLLALWLPITHFFLYLLPYQTLLFYRTHSLSEAMAFAQWFTRKTVMYPDFYLVSPQSIVQEFLDALTLHSIPLPLRDDRMFEFSAIKFAQNFAGYVVNLVRLI
jgi:hypothetical protein